MRVALKSRLATFVALFAFAVASGAPSKDEILQVSEGPDHFTLVVPVSGLTLSLPKGGLVEGRNEHGGAAAHPRYFYFQEKSDDVSLIVSGWFEPQGKFVSAQKVWDDDTKEWTRRGLRSPTDISFQKISGWDAVVYDMPVPVPGAHNTHIRAHWVQTGTWIDLHISITARRPIAECRAQILALLKSISVTAKK